MLSRTVTIAVMLFALLNAPMAQEDDTNESWLTRSGYYRVSYISRLDPLTINRIHDWVFHIESADGAPVDGAIVSVTGGMPKHNHGLPTDPRMTQALGNGDYVLEGMRFHMNGYWELTVTVDAGGRRDTVIIPLTI
jgi:hypothetical protein